MASNQTNEVDENVTENGENMQTAEDDNMESEESDEYKNCDFSTKSWREDMVLIVEGEKLHVASNILSLLSPVFTSMFDNQFKEGGPREVELPGKKLSDMKEFLLCIYPNIQKRVSDENVHVLLPLADEFQVIRLLKSCEEFLLKDIAEKSAEEICICLQHACRYKLTNLKTACLDVVVDFHTNHFIEAEKKNPLPLEISAEIKDLQIADLGKSVTEMEDMCQNLTEFIKYFWMEKHGNPKFLGSDFRTLTLTLEDMSTFVEESSSSESVNGIDWYFFVQTKDDKKGKQHLSIYLTAEAPDEWRDWSCEALAKIMILNKADGLPYRSEDSFSTTFTSEDHSFGNPEYISMAELKRKYVIDGAVTVKMFIFVNEAKSKPLQRD